MSLLGKTPAEWLTPDERSGIFGSFQCIEFSPDDGGGDEPPKPLKPMPGQGALFPEDDTHQGPRMFVDVVNEIRHSEVVS